MELSLEKKFFIPLLCLSILLAGCTAGFIPKDAKPAGVYKGILKGSVYDGPIQVELHQTPDGKTLFTGHYVDTIHGGEYQFRGTVTGRSLEGDISMGFGTITGELSEDRTRMSGVFRLVQNHGTWSAGLQ